RPSNPSPPASRVGLRVSGTGGVLVTPADRLFGIGEPGREPPVGRSIPPGAHAPGSPAATRATQGAVDRPSSRRYHHPHSFRRARPGFPRSSPMLTKRLIPCLDVDRGRVVKG